MSEARKVLNLDELFGDAQTLDVRHEGMTYQLPRLKTLSPKKWQRFQDLGKQAGRLKDIKPQDATGREVEGVERLLDQMLMLLCKDLPLKPLAWWQRWLMVLRIKQFVRPLTLDEKTRVVTFYTQQDEHVKKALPGGRKQTGARHSAG